MDSSNAVKEVANPNNARKEKSNQPIICSPVPDLVTNVPTTASTATTPTGASTTNTDASPVQPPSIKPTPSPSVVVKTAIPTTQPIPVPNTPRATSLPSAASEASVKNRSRDEKSRKKDDKSVDHVLRALNSLNTTEEKLAAMCKKYADIFDEHRKLQLLHKQTEKRCSMLQREKEQLQVEHSKAILTRSRLENLCRELQRQNKAIKDESLLKIREEEEKRKEVSAKFQTTMNEITSLMQQNNDKNMKLRDDNIDMTTKLKNICEQYEIRQQQVERISKQMQLEQQLADAKLSKLKMEMAAEKEALLREKQQLLMELQSYQQRCTEYQTTEVNLRNQISMYNDKYDEFQKALARSNDVFGGFKGEMDKMSKKINKLEKETSSWKQRWERSHTALLEMGADKQKSEQELAVVSRQLATLQNLCRTLQTERSSLLAKLKTFQGQSHQCGGHEPLEKEVCVKQPPQQHVCDPPLNHVTGTDHYAQDIMANTAAEATVTPSPLPDVVGVTNTCALDVNSALCPRLDNITLESSVPVLAESASVETPQPNVPVTQQLSAEPVVETPAVVNGGDEPVVETPAVVNGEAHTNGLSPSDQDKEQPSLDSPQTSPKSPSLKGSPAKSAENGKKAKESMKKKKK